VLYGAVLVRLCLCHHTTIVDCHLRGSSLFQELGTLFKVVLWGWCVFLGGDFGFYPGSNVSVYMGF